MITASLVVYQNNRDELFSAITSIIRSNAVYLYVIDNSPTDELKSFIISLSDKIIYVFGHGNVGYGCAHNIAIGYAVKAGSNYHAIINPDVYFGPDTVAALGRYMDTHTQVGLVMPKVVYPNGELQYLCKLLPTPMDLIGRRFVISKSYLRKRNYTFELRGSRYDKEMPVPFLSGCFMFCRTDVLRKVGGFSDKYFMYCEDIDLCRRILRAGYVTMYYPGTTIVHAHKKASFKNKKMFKIHIKSAITYFNTWGWLFDKERKKINRETLREVRKRESSL